MKDSRRSHSFSLPEKTNVLTFRVGLEEVLWFTGLVDRFLVESTKKWGVRSATENGNEMEELSPLKRFRLTLNGKIYR
jgi:hypothetical protein